MTTEMNYAEEAGTSLVIRNNDGTETPIERITGGGMLIGGDGYEVSFIDEEGNDGFFYQHDIAEVFDPVSGERFQFGNPWLPGHPSNR